MVLSTMFAVKGDLERQRDFCRRVMMAGAAALFVKTTRFVENMPADVIELADKRGFPIVEVPQGLRLDAADAGRYRSHNQSPRLRSWSSPNRSTGTFLGW